jgi:hypothetical protein
MSKRKAKKEAKQRLDEIERELEKLRLINKQAPPSRTERVYTYDDQRRADRAAKEAERASKEAARKEKLDAMTDEERAAFLKKERHERKQKILFGSIVGAIVLILIIVAAVSSSNEKKKYSSTVETTAESIEETTTEAPTTTTLPPPQAVDGRGDDVVTLQAQGPLIVHASYTGGSNFVIKGLDASNGDTDLLVNTIGAYNGTTALDFDKAVTKSLQITASGPWHLDISSPLSATHFTGSYSGKGDNVLIYDGSSGVATISHDGSSNFVIHTVNSGSADLLVNEIGVYNGKQPWPSGPAFIEINADGNWTITVA